MSLGRTHNRQPTSIRDARGILVDDDPTSCQSGGSRTQSWTSSSSSTTFSICSLRQEVDSPALRDVVEFAVYEIDEVNDNPANPLGLLLRALVQSPSTVCHPAPTLVAHAVVPVLAAGDRAAPRAVSGIGKRQRRGSGEGCTLRTPACPVPPHKQNRAERGKLGARDHPARLPG